MSLFCPKFAHFRYPILPTPSTGTPSRASGHGSPDPPRHSKPSLELPAGAHGGRRLARGRGRQKRPSPNRSARSSREGGRDDACITGKEMSGAARGRGTSCPSSLHCFWLRADDGRVGRRRLLSGTKQPLAQAAEERDCLDRQQGFTGGLGMSSTGGPAHVTSCDGLLVHDPR